MKILIIKKKKNINVIISYSSKKKILIITEILKTLILTAIPGKTQKIFGF